MKIMGTSTCDIMVAPYEVMQGKLVRGICGQVDGSVIPGMVGLKQGSRPLVTSCLVQAGLDVASRGIDRKRIDRRNKQSKSKTRYCRGLPRRRRPCLSKTPKLLPWIGLTAEELRMRIRLSREPWQV